MKSSIAKGVSVVIGLALASATGGCQFYSVSSKDKPTGYITHNWACYQKNGNARFKDLKTGEEVRLSEVNVLGIPEDEAWAEVAAASSPRSR